MTLPLSLMLSGWAENMAQKNGQGQEFIEYIPPNIPPLIPKDDHLRNPDLSRNHQNRPRKRQKKMVHPQVKNHERMMNLTKTRGLLWRYDLLCQAPMYQTSTEYSSLQNVSNSAPHFIPVLMADVNIFQSPAYPVGNCGVPSTSNRQILIEANNLSATQFDNTNFKSFPPLQVPKWSLATGESSTPTPLNSTQYNPVVHHNDQTIKFLEQGPSPFIPLIEGEYGEANLNPNCESSLLNEIEETNTKLKIMREDCSMDVIAPFSFFDPEKFSEEQMIHKVLWSSRLAFSKDAKKEDKNEPLKFSSENQISLTSEQIKKATSSKLSAFAEPFILNPQSKKNIAPKDTEQKKTAEKATEMEIVDFLDFVERIEGNTVRQINKPLLLCAQQNQIRKGSNQRNDQGIALAEPEDIGGEVMMFRNQAEFGSSHGAIGDAKPEEELPQAANATEIQDVEKSTAMEAKSTAVEGTSTAVERTSTVVEGISTAVERTSTDVEETSTVVERTSTAVEATNTVVEKTSTAVEGTSTVVERTSTAVEGTSTVVERTSTAVEGTSTAVEGKSTAVEEKSTAVEKISTAMKGTTTAVEKTCTAVKGTRTVEETSTSNVAATQGAEVKIMYLGRDILDLAANLVGEWAEINRWEVAPDIPIQTSTNAIGTGRP